jgi:HAD superfamily hydrolase (TIGR01490 family)
VAPKIVQRRNRYRSTGEAAAAASGPTGDSDNPDGDATVAENSPEGTADDDKTMERPEGHTHRAGAAGFFDIDNTIMRGSSMFHFARGAASHGLISGKDIARFAVAQLRFAMFGGENMDEMTEAVEAGLTFVKGRSVDEIVQLGEDVFDDTMSDKMWTGTLALAQTHLDAGEPVWLVSATPIEVAKILADRLGFTGALGTVSEVKDNHYTGNLVGYPLHGAAKAEGVRALARRRGYNLANCWAYSDSANDLPLLSMVGHPVAVNPDSDLRGQARDNNWPIYNFRGKRTVKRIGIPAATAAGLAAAGATGTEDRS